MDTSELLNNIICSENIQTLFQPIVSLKTGDILGYEALSRGPQNSSLYSPLSLIEAALKEEKLWELETLFRKNAIREAHRLGLDSLLFLNVEPNIIHDPKFQEGFTKNYMSDYQLKPEQIIFEITERSAVSNFDNFKTIIEHYRSQGYQIAIDDTGAGYSNLAALCKIKPYYIKIDMEIVRNIHKDSFKQALLNSFVIMSNLTNTRLIAEGIESYEELVTITQLGIHAAQGFLIGQPSEGLSSIDPDILEIIKGKNSCSFSTPISNKKNIGEISEPIPSFDASVKCADLKDFFKNNHGNIEGICILEKGEVAGLIMKNDINAILSGQYGYSLYAKKPVRKIMDATCLTVDYSTPINVVAELAMSRTQEKIYDNIIVTKGLKYWGIVSVIKLLKQFLMMEKSTALELNPLTGLPGNTLINKALEDAIQLKNPIVVLYIDLDNFKIYNDIYGFEKGDNVIKMTRDAITACINQDFYHKSFIGHIGGDDFVAIIQCDYESSLHLCKQIIEYFDENVLDNFSEEDKEKGYMYGKDRNDIFREFPLTSVSIGGIYGILNCFQSPKELAMYMSEVKKKAKRIKKSSYIIESLTSPL